MSQEHRDDLVETGAALPPRRLELDVDAPARSQLVVDRAGARHPHRHARRATSTMRSGRGPLLLATRIPRLRRPEAQIDRARRIVAERAHLRLAEMI